MAATTPRKSLTIPAPLIKRMKKADGAHADAGRVRIRTTQVTADDYKKAFEGWLEQGLDVLSISDPSLDGLFSVLFPLPRPQGEGLAFHPLFRFLFCFGSLKSRRAGFSGIFPSAGIGRKKDGRPFTARLR